MLEEKWIEDRDRRVTEKIAENLSILVSQVEKTVELIDDGNTIPFIARYRKEVTGSLDDDQLRILDDQLKSLRNLEDTKVDVIRKIENQGKLTDELEKAIINAETLKRIDDYYLPFKQKRKTRADKAREANLGSLAEKIMNSEVNGEEELSEYISEACETVEDALQGARDIISEEMAETASIREWMRRNLWNSGVLKTSVTKEAKENQESMIYEMYFSFEEEVPKLPSHRVLAINRAEKESVLRVKIETTDDRNLFRIKRDLIRSKQIRFNDFCNNQLELGIEDGYKRLLYPSIENETRQALTEIAEKEAIDIFGKNLRPYLMQPPLKKVVIMGLDPGFRTGCKVAVIDENGAVLDHSTIYPTAPKNDVEGSISTMMKLVNKHGVSLIAIGNGTASRETEQVVGELIKKVHKLNAEYVLNYAIVNESGASIYSASKLGAEEFPQYDVTIRGAISIARRIQDPLAELVKIEPKHIGVGQYQHDVNQKKLEESLTGVVESCVNTVGVNVNTASPSLLGYISGINKTIAKNIVQYKEENGAYKSRKELKKVKGLGNKAFEQCAGFLRIPDGIEPLDNTAVHPESYSIAKKIMNLDYENIDIEAKAEELNVGLPTIQDILEELKKPGRDPRDEAPEVVLSSEVLSMDDLKEGMELNGTVRNVVAFGCFVDIGVKQDGLVHISEMGDGFYSDAADIVSVSDIVRVKIISIDKKRDRIGLSMKGIKQSESIEEKKKKAAKYSVRNK